MLVAVGSNDQVELLDGDAQGIYEVVLAAPVTVLWTGA